MAFEGWQENISDLVRDIGRACTVRTTVTTGGNSFDPQSGTAAVTETPAIAAFFKFNTNEVDGSSVKRTDRKIVLSSDVPVTKDNDIVDGSTVYHIIDVLTTQPDENTYMYIVQGRA